MEVECRPIKDLVDGLKQMNVEIGCETGCPPLTIKYPVTGLSNIPPYIKFLLPVDD